MQQGCSAIGCVQGHGLGLFLHVAILDMYGLLSIKHVILIQAAIEVDPGLSD